MSHNCLWHLGWACLCLHFIQLESHCSCCMWPSKWFTLFDKNKAIMFTLVKVHVFKLVQVCIFVRSLCLKLPWLSLSFPSLFPSVLSSLTVYSATLFSSASTAIFKIVIAVVSYLFIPLDYELCESRDHVVYTVYPVPTVITSIS